jgi:hypothetical protein
MHGRKGITEGSEHCLVRREIIEDMSKLSLNT